MTHIIIAQNICVGGLHVFVTLHPFFLNVSSRCRVCEIFWVSLDHLCKQDAHVCVPPSPLLPPLCIFPGQAEAFASIIPLSCEMLVKVHSGEAFRFSHYNGSPLKLHVLYPFWKVSCCFWYINLGGWGQLDRLDAYMEMVNRCHWACTCGCVCVCEREGERDHVG